MKHPIHSVKTVAGIPPYTLRLSFGDETTQIIDLEPMLRGELYGPLRDESVFGQVSIDSEVHTVIWSNGADFDPATLHDWPVQGPALIAQAQRWPLMEKAC